MREAEYSAVYDLLIKACAGHPDSYVLLFAESVLDEVIESANVLLKAIRDSDEWTRQVLSPPYWT